MKTITIADHKGGVARTTTALNIIVLLAHQVTRVLAGDLSTHKAIFRSRSALSFRSWKRRIALRTV